MIYGVETQAAQATTGPPSFFTQAVIIDNAAVASGIYKNAQSTADNALLTISLWARCADVSSSPTFVTLAAGEMYMQAKFSFATDIVFIARNSAATKTVQLGSANGVFSTATTGNHIFASFDTNHAAGAKLLNLYVNGANVKNGGNTFDTDIAFTIGFSGKNMGVPADQAFLASTQIATIHFAEVWMAIGQYVDPANLTKFRSATGHPVDLGSNGQSPTGTAPTYYFKGPAASFHTNLGTGATMTSEGSITSSSWVP